ncbi:hypothetical protein LZ31DRAFT_601022 [Colletotrichum somersetense]|nr:hypothetical protein LZ31DRAFT_601022 [Colletotrichum somersetense]
MTIVNGNWSDDDIDIGPFETEVDEIVSLVVDRLCLCPSIRSSTQALIVHVHSDSKVWLLECAIYSRSCRYTEEIRSVDDLCIDVAAITPLQSYDWFNQKRFNDIHIFNSARLLSDRRLLFKKAYRCLEPEGFWDVQDFNRTLRCDDGTCTEDDIAQRIFEETNLRRSAKRIKTLETKIRRIEAKIQKHHKQHRKQRPTIGKRKELRKADKPRNPQQTDFKPLQSPDTFSEYSEARCAVPWPTSIFAAPQGMMPATGDVLDLTYEQAVMQMSITDGHV